MNHPRTIDAISAAWVTEILRGADVVRQSSVRAVDISPIGQGVGFLSNRARLTLTYDRAEEGAPATVVVKMPASAKEGVAFAESTHVYEREIRFYREVAPHTPIRVPRVYATPVSSESATQQDRRPRILRPFRDAPREPRLGGSRRITARPPRRRCASGSRPAREHFDRHRSVALVIDRLRPYIGDMISGPLIAEIASLVGEPTRATMLSALLDGRALTASELAFAARVTPQTASTHLAKLTEAGLLLPIREGRHRYFRLASPKVVEMLDGIVALALENRPRYRPLSRQARELSAARICYDHLAGRLSVDLTDSLITHEYIMVGDEAAEITQAGTRFLTEFGIDLSALNSTRRHFCRLCLDWTERRPHIAGAVGAALTKRCFDLGWTERMKHSGAVIVTASGKHGFRETFGIGMPEETGNGTRGQ